MIAAARHLAQAPPDGKQRAYTDYRAAYRQVHNIPSRVKGVKAPRA